MLIRKIISSCFAAYGIISLARKSNNLIFSSSCYVSVFFVSTLYNNLCTKTALNIVTLVSHSQETGDKKTACIYCGVIMHAQQPITLQTFYFLYYNQGFHFEGFFPFCDWLMRRAFFLNSGQKLLDPDWLRRFILSIRTKYQKYTQ